MKIRVKRLEKQMGVWMIPKRHWSLILTQFSEKGILTWLTKIRKTKPNVVKESITPPISGKKIDTVNRTDRSNASNKTVDTPKSNKTDKVRSIDKSRSTRITDTENKVDKSRSVPRTNLYNKSTIIEKPSEIDIHRGKLSVSVLFGQGESLSSVTPDILCIPRKNKRNKTPYT